MERLAWIEILDRHGDVSARHPVHAWPLKVGRAYTSDIVLDDPYVAPNHLEVRHADDGLFRLKVLEGNNAMTVGKGRGRQSEADVSANDVVRIGQTQLRIRPANYAVPAEKSLPNKAWARSWPGLFVAGTTFVLACLLTLWLNYDRADGYNILATPIIGGLVLLLLWAGFWALIGRVVAGRANFIAHAVNAALGVALFIVLDGSLYGYADFAFNTDLMSSVISAIVGTLIIGTLAYRHIGLVSRISRRALTIIVVALTTGLLGLGYVSEAWTEDEHLTDMSFSGAIGPPFMSLTHGNSTEAFIDGANDLKKKVDKMRDAQQISANGKK